MGLVVWLSASLVFSQSVYLQGLSSKFSHQDMIKGYKALITKSNLKSTKPPTANVAATAEDHSSHASLQLYKVKDAKKVFLLKQLTRTQKS